ncbi:RES family NAD+ phosphorylase, partial [Pseudoalteromonas sp. NBT06-2]|uniref:RES family NAD+ phosphorylase n=1 Tax=Pseudoalteromonas sp. NBT06-2 TaxID=2025950 RepID=UPI001140AB6A
QSLTNPRLKAEVGDLGLVNQDDIPFGITGCSYATAPFTHINPDGSRFSHGDAGVLYVADSMETALAEVTHHQQHYFSNVVGLHYDRIVLRGLKVKFDEGKLHDLTNLDITDPVYDKQNYTNARQLGNKLRTDGIETIKYNSVRNEGAICWAMLTPKNVQEVIQSTHFALIWNGEKITSAESVSLV